MPSGLEREEEPVKAGESWRAMLEAFEEELEWWGLAAHPFWTA